MSSYSNSTQTDEKGAGQRNKKTRALSALLSATALGVFLEGCGAGQVASDATDATNDAGSGLDFLLDDSLDNQLASSFGDDSIVVGAGDDALGVVVSDDALDDGSGDDKLGGGASYGGTFGGVRDLHLYGDEGNNILFGGAGNDGIFGLGGDDKLYGDKGHDVIDGSAGDDKIYGGVGNDHLDGGAGDDEVYGGAGNDDLEGGKGADVLDGGDGTDGVTYFYSSKGVRIDLNLEGEQEDFDGENNLQANGNEAVGDILIGIENIMGSGEGDWLTGDEHDNVFYGGRGVDILEGGGGDDKLYGDVGDDELNGGAGADVLSGGKGTDYVNYRDSEAGVRVSLDREEGQEDFDGTYGFVANGNDAVGDTLSSIEVLEGSAHADWLTGNDDANWLVGNAGNDRLEGGGGDDTLYGLDGDDTLLGGEGTDRYFFRIADGSDTISDFSEEGDDVMFLRFQGLYEAEDFESAAFDRVEDDLVISLDKQADDGIEDKITILNAYDSDPDTGKDNAAFSISISYGQSHSESFAVTDIWSDLVV